MKKRLKRVIFVALIAAFLLASIFAVFRTYQLKNEIEEMNQRKYETQETTQLKYEIKETNQLKYDIVNDCTNVRLKKCDENNNVFPLLFPWIHQENDNDYDTKSTSPSSYAKKNRSDIVIYDEQHAAIDTVDAGDCIKDRTNTIRCFPYFLVLGIQKSATTELSNWLRRHPSIRLADGHTKNVGIKGEAHFFDAIQRDDTMDKRKIHLNYENVIGLPIEQAWREYINRERFVMNHADVGRVILFDKTPAYWYRADPEDIAKLIPSVRLIVITRDPSERLNSAFYHCHRTSGRAGDINKCGGVEPSPCGLIKGLSQSLCVTNDGQVEISARYLENINLEDRMDNFWVRQFAMGLDNYNVLMNRWLRYFSETQLLHLRFEDFVNSPYETMDRVMNFLELERFDFHQSLKKRKQRRKRKKFPLPGIARIWLDAMFSRYSSD